MSATNRDYQEYLESLGFAQRPWSSEKSAENSAGQPQLDPSRNAAPAVTARMATTAAPQSLPAPVPASVPMPATVKVTSAEENEVWESLRAACLECVKCPLSASRTNAVFGVGDPNARLMFIGEGPGTDEDLSGEPFVGKAGQLLTKMIEAMKLTREDVYITTVVKCRPPDNRNPEPDEISTCVSNYLKNQIELVKPDVIVALGTIASKVLLNNDATIPKLRGKFYDLPDFIGQSGNPVQVMPTYHPAYLLRNADMKKPVWEDLKLVMALLNNSAS